MKARPGLAPGERRRAREHVNRRVVGEIIDALARVPLRRPDRGAGPIVPPAMRMLTTPGMISVLTSSSISRLPTRDETRTFSCEVSFLCAASSGCIKRVQRLRPFTRR